MKFLKRNWFFVFLIIFLAILNLLQGIYNTVRFISLAKYSFSFSKSELEDMTKEINDDLKKKQDEKN